MKADEFIRRVQDGMCIDSPEAAATLIEAVLETLGERTHQAEREKIAAQLPSILREPFSRSTETHDYDLEEFVNRVNARANIGCPDAVNQIKVVMAVLDKALSPKVLRKILGALPHEFQDLFQQVPEGPLSPVRED